MSSLLSVYKMMTFSYGGSLTLNECMNSFIVCIHSVYDNRVNVDDGIYKHVC